MVAQEVTRARAERQGPRPAELGIAADICLDRRDGAHGWWVWAWGMAGKAGQGRVWARQGCLRMQWDANRKLSLREVRRDGTQAKTCWMAGAWLLSLVNCETESCRQPESCRESES